MDLFGVIAHVLDASDDRLRLVFVASNGEQQANQAKLRASRPRLSTSIHPRVRSSAAALDT